MARTSEPIAFRYFSLRQLLSNLAQDSAAPSHHCPTRLFRGDLGGKGWAMIMDYAMLCIFPLVQWNQLLAATTLHYFVIALSHRDCPTGSRPPWRKSRILATPGNARTPVSYHERGFYFLPCTLKYAHSPPAIVFRMSDRKSLFPQDVHRILVGNPAKRACRNRFSGVHSRTRFAQRIIHWVDAFLYARTAIAIVWVGLCGYDRAPARA
jgi:hypothetical protein